MRVLLRNSKNAGLLFSAERKETSGGGAWAVGWEDSSGLGEIRAIDDRVTYRHPLLPCRTECSGRETKRVEAGGSGRKASGAYMVPGARRKCSAV